MILILLTSVVGTCAFLLTLTDSLVPFGIICFIFAFSLCNLIGLFICSWIGLIIFLVYIGGLIVIFAYFLAICPNQQIVFKWKRHGIVTFFLLRRLLTYRGKLTIPSWRQEGMSSTILYSGKEFSLLVLLALTLFITLVAVVKVVELKRGPLRPFVVRTKKKRCDLILFNKS